MGMKVENYEKFQQWNIIWIERKIRNCNQCTGHCISQWTNFFWENIKDEIRKYISFANSACDLHITIADFMFSANAPCHSLSHHTYGTGEGLFSWHPVNQGKESQISRIYGQLQLQLQLSWTSTANFDYNFNYNFWLNWA